MNLFCLLTGHKPYEIGMLTHDFEFSDPDADGNFKIKITPNDNRRMICLGCSKTLKKIDKDAK